MDVCITGRDNTPRVEIFFMRNSIKIQKSHNAICAVAFSDCLCGKGRIANLTGFSMMWHCPTNPQRSGLEPYAARCASTRKFNY